MTLNIGLSGLHSVQISDPKKSESRAVQGYFMGRTKSRVLIHWWDPSTNQVKHAFAV